MSTIEKIAERIAGIEEYLRRQKTDVKNEQAHLQEGSRESLYWHYGYMVALKDMQKQAARDKRWDH
jgi:hypothetical protein